jgi:hypothetical protein
MIVNTAIRQLFMTRKHVRFGIKISFEELPFFGIFFASNYITIGKLLKDNMVINFIQCIRIHLHV